MKRILFILVCFFHPILAFGQEMVKINILELYDTIPAPPADARTAHSRLVCAVENGFENCEAKKFYQATTDALAALELQITKTNAALAQPGVRAMQQIDPKEMQKKIDAMSPEEKIQFAMQMSQMALGMQNVQPESEEVQEALAEFGEVSVAVNSEYTNPDEIARKKLQLDADRQRKHDEIDAWAKTEHAKIPQVAGGPGVGMIPEPNAAHALRISTVDKHLAVDDEYLTALQKWWPEEIKKQKARFTPFQQKLAAVDYGGHANNTVHKQTLVQGQSMMLNTAAALAQFSRDVSESAGRRWQDKLKVEKEKP